MSTPITKVDDLKQAIHNATCVLVPVRFGIMERWVKISKVDANEIAKGLGAHAAVSNYVGIKSFGEVEDGMLFLAS